MRILFGALLLFLMSITFAQQEEEWRTINSVTEWLEEINNWPDSVYNQKNLEVLFDHDKDKGLVGTFRDELDGITQKSAENAYWT